MAQKVDKHLKNIRAIEKNIKQVIAQKKKKKKEKKKAEYGRKAIQKVQVIE